MSDGAQPLATTETVPEGLDMDNGILGVSLRLDQNEPLDAVKAKVATICEMDLRGREGGRVEWLEGKDHDDFVAGPVDIQ